MHTIWFFVLYQLQVQIANTVKDKHNIKSVVSFGETVGLAFQEGPDVFKYSSDFIRQA